MNKPVKPPAPVKPNELYESFEPKEITDVYNGDEIKLDPSKTWFFGSDYGDCYFYTKEIVMKPYPNYKYRLAAYNKQLKSYPDRLAKYKEKLEKWEAANQKKIADKKAKQEKAERKLLEELKKKYEHI